jgi:hypothetical protein
LVRCANTVEEDGVATLEILDALQRVVFKPLDHERQSAGSFAFLLPLAHLPAGTYTVRLMFQTASGQMHRSAAPIIIIR